jgi:hypothetical protein
MSSNLLSQPWSFLSIPVVWLTVALPELYKVCIRSLLVTVKLTNFLSIKVRTLHNTQGFKFDP